MEPVLATLEATAVAEYLRGSRWTYAAVNAVHIFGIALLVGGILPLDLRLLGFWRDAPLRILARVLVPVAATGLTIAIMAGFLLFSVRAREYSGVGFLQIKVALVLVGSLTALWFHHQHGLSPEGASRNRRAGHALLSMTCWGGALVCGRMIAFSGD